MSGRGRGSRAGAAGADTGGVSPDVRAILRLEVPVIVVLGRRTLRLGEVTSLAVGAIVELPKNADDELELCVNNKVVGTGRAVKVGENFGIRINFIGDVRQRIAAMGGGGAVGGDAAVSAGGDPAAAAPARAEAAELVARAA